MKEKEFLGFSKSMLLQCVALYIGICLGLWVNKYFYILVALFTFFIALTKDIKNVYYHLLFTMPFTVIYKMSPSSSSLFAYVVILAGMILVLRVKSFQIDRLFSILLFAVYLFIGMGDNYTTALKMIMGFVLLSIFVRKIDSDSHKNHIMAFVLGNLGSSAIGTFRGSFPRLDAYFYRQLTISSNNFLTTRFTGLNYDPNFYAMSAIFVIVLCCLLYFRKIGNKFFVLFLTAVQLYFGFISYSKMFLLMFVIIALIMLIYIMKTPKRLILSFISIAAVGSVIWYFLEKAKYIDIMMNRLDSGDISTGRFGLWKAYSEFIFSSVKNLFLGKGIGYDYLSVGGPHNTYLEAIFFVGILGSLFLIAAIIFIFKGQKLLFKRDILNYILILVFCFMIGTLGCFTINEFSFYLILIWIGFNLKKVNVLE